MDNVARMSKRPGGESLVEDFTMKCSSIDGLACYTRVRRAVSTYPNLGGR